MPGASAAWVVDDCDGILLSDGTVSIRVRGLVQSSDASNPNATFTAIVSCTTLDSTGTPVIDTVSTAAFTATTAGNCNIHDSVTLPSPCIAPVVFIADPAGNWLAATGM